MRLLKSGVEEAAGALWMVAHNSTPNQVAVARAGAIGPLARMLVPGFAGARPLSAGQHDAECALLQEPP